MEPKKNAFDLSKCARPNILALEPYRCARDDYKDNGKNILLDANENAYGPGLALNTKTKPTEATVNGTANGALNGVVNGDLSHEDGVGVDLLGLNRYPDPHQIPLKELLCKLRNTHTHTPKDLTPDNLFVGVGSDEAIDALLRCFCIPGRDQILTCPPTYGMYSVSAQVNDISIVKVPLIGPGFILDVGAITAALTTNPTIKLVYLCSPGNPTGQLLSKASLKAILEHPSWNGVLVLDEAYIDFAPAGSSLAEWTLEWPNLVVMQTLSKAFGLAGIRLGAAFTSPPIARLLNALKAPYNVSNPSSQLARAALMPPSLRVMQAKRDLIVKQRDRLLRELPRIPGIGRFLGGTDANFLLVEMLDLPRDMGGTPCNVTALRVYEKLAVDKGVVVRFRGREEGCEGCLRVTVGTEKEVDRFLKEIRNVLEIIYISRNYAPVNGVVKPAEDKAVVVGGMEEAKEQANGGAGEEAMEEAREEAKVEEKPEVNDLGEEKEMPEVDRMVEDLTPMSEIGLQEGEEPTTKEVEEEGAHEGEVHERGVQEDEVQEKEAMEAEMREAEMREAERREAELREEELRDAELRDSELRDAESRDAVLKEKLREELKEVVSERVKQKDEEAEAEAEYAEEEEPKGEEPKEKEAEEEAEDMIKEDTDEEEADDVIEDKMDDMVKEETDEETDKETNEKTNAEMEEETKEKLKEAKEEKAKQADLTEDEEERREIEASDIIP
ncbi:histidinol-phosphate aminotransferase [Glonium stellatum]|uniref:histidinol-phosphate transaminase n=1 Tax=Glonium stellatum TaxID=574774 RepID=A0A8E2JQ51_9PEZI|nr:histidinol-phosphate aminotransferase [Glonium stellatum]